MTLAEFINQFHKNDGSKFQEAFTNSTRTSFTLSQDAVEALKYISNCRNSSLKSTLFFLLFSFNEYDELKEIINQTQDSDKVRIRKTYVINNFVIQWLNTVSKDENIPRDRIVENIIIHERDRIKLYNEKRRKNIEIIEDLIDKYDEAFSDVSNKIEELFDKDDPIIDSWYQGACAFGGYNGTDEDIYI